MIRAQRSALRFRRFILIAGLLYALSAILWCTAPLWFENIFNAKEFFPAGLLGTPLALGLDLDESQYAVAIIIFFALVLIAQYSFLMPRGNWTARLAIQGRPLKSAVITAAAMATLLSLGAIALILEMPDAWAPWMGEVADGNIYAIEFRSVLPYFLVGSILTWGLWIVIFGTYWRRGDRYSQLTAMLRWLIAGSFLEAFVAVPVHVWAVRQRECYCTRGTYTTLVCAGTVLLWAFGPGIILLYMFERRRAAKLFPRCEKCDYDLRGIDSQRCPECGHPAPDS